MEKKEKEYDGFVANGFLMLFLAFAMLGGAICNLIANVSQYWGATIGVSIVLLVFFIIWCQGFIKLEPNEARIMVFFGKYKGSFTRTGFYWVNPFMSIKKVSLRARNLNVDPIKVNDKTGNPIMIGLVLVWKLQDTYKALFEIDSETMATQPADPKAVQPNAAVINRMNAFESFVKVQSDAALRQVAGLYAYDDTPNDKQHELTLRSSADEVNEELVQKLNERLAMAGIVVVEARINYLAYAQEIAAVMLRRQQADAIITAREKIVEGAVSMVKMALDKLAEDDIVELDDEKRVAMVSNLLVVLCADEPAQPVLNTGTLNH